jgi:AcrR family transcriptional regulator
MRAKEVGRTFTENARRAQIVRAAVETIAELGYAKASFARIAERAGLSSTGLISYHFSGKEELMARVVATVHSEIGAFMHAQVSAAPTPTAMLSAYIEGVVAFIAGHRVEMTALLDIFLNFRPERGEGSYDDGRVLTPIEGILLAGQECGEFRPFDTGVMAMAIQRAVDGLPFALEAQPDLDLDLYARELVALFTRAVTA